MSGDFFFCDDLESFWNLENSFGSGADPFPADPPRLSNCHRRTFSSPAAMSIGSMFEELPPKAHVREASLPMDPSAVDDDFARLCNDPYVTFDARELGFVPTGHWAVGRFTFGELVRDFFQRKSSGNTRFLHKLYNALKISGSDPFYSEFVGAEWVNDRVLKIDKKTFARLLGIKAIDGSLFHRQGNFPSHGFIEIGPTNGRGLVDPNDLASVDHDDVRLLVHEPGKFQRTSTPDVLEKCHWINSKHRP
jgi:hypothetical protein